MRIGEQHPDITGNPYIDGLLSGYRWQNTSLSYGFAQDTKPYTSGSGPQFAGFAPVSDETEQTVRYLLKGISPAVDIFKMSLTPVEGFTSLVFRENSPTPDGADILLAHSKSA